MASQLITHRGAVRISKSQLYDIPAPPATTTFRPVKHSDLVNLLTDHLRERHFLITKEEYAVQNQGLLLFGVIDFAKRQSDVHTASIGFSTSNNKSLSLRIMTAARVCVCDNLMMSGSSIIIKRKHTKGLNIGTALSEGLDRYEAELVSFNRTIETWQRAFLTDEEAKSLLLDGFKAGALPLKLFHPITSGVFKTPVISLWSVHNACTTAFKELAPRPQFDYTMKLGRFLDGNPERTVDGDDRAGGEEAEYYAADALV